MIIGRQAIRRASTCHRLALGAALAVGMLLAGCASIKGVQDQVTAADLNARVCPSSANVATFNGLTGPAKAAFRNDVVADCIAAITRKYSAFKASFHTESVVDNVTTDVLALGLTTASTLTKGGTNKTLAGLAGLSLGVGTTINKDVFYQQAIPAIESTMDTRRDAVLKTIIDAEKADPSGQSYTLNQASVDLDALQAAGDIALAISDLTKSANVQAVQAKAALTVSQQKPGAPYVAVALATDVYSRLKKLTDAIWSLRSPADQTKLSAIAAKLNVDVSSVSSFQDEQALVVDAIDKQAMSGDSATQLKSLENTISPLLS